MDNIDKYKIKGDKGTKGVYSSKHIRMQTELQLKIKEK